MRLKISPDRRNDNRKTCHAGPARRQAGSKGDFVIKVDTVCLSIWNELRLSGATLTLEDALMMQCLH